LINEITPDQAYLTHVSHEIGFHDEVNKKLPSNVRLAYDGLELFV
jgi:phosphoribosyl 1,2-cyclic phosphate phosphodiesterase